MSPSTTANNLYDITTIIRVVVVVVVPLTLSTMYNYTASVTSSIAD